MCASVAKENGQYCVVTKKKRLGSTISAVTDPVMCLQSSEDGSRFPSLVCQVANF